MRKPEKRPNSARKLESSAVLDTVKYLEGLRRKFVVEQKPHKTPKPKLFTILIVSALIVLAALLFIANPSLIGFVTSEKEFVYNDSINKEFTSDSEYLWEVNNPGFLKSVRLYVQYLNGTKAKVYIENDDSRY